MRNVYNMMDYSLESRNQIFLKDYGSLSFAKNMSKNIDEIKVKINKNR